MLQHANRRCTRPPAGDDLHEPGCNTGRIEHAAVQQNRIRTACGGVGMKKPGELARDGRILGVRQTEFLKCQPCAAARQIVSATVREKAVQNDLFDFVSREFRRHRPADQAPALGEDRQVIRVARNQSEQ